HPTFSFSPSYQVTNSQLELLDQKSSERTTITLATSNKAQATINNMAGCFTIFTAPAQALCSLFARKSTSAEAERERELNKTRINWTVEHPVSDASTNWGSRTSSAYSTGGSIPSRSSTADEITPLNAPAKPAKKAKRPKAKKEKLHEFFDQKTRKWVYLTESELEDEEEEPPLKYAQHWNNVHRMRMSSGEMKKAANGRVTVIGMEAC
ncbi:hypothetical protein SAICODRAFT_224880, partial [Saitoella complicata NRRL Y-17804]|uniref:uncharacterized protein n=1 Tax=Saitoella complicata (strain BCRC 22490 / CBS 7301 / JCM 7358 / NBRC 10748 / NRRL Y-17804) TaxID=698492 RepID=UPI000866EE59